MSDTVIKIEGLCKKFCRSLKRSMAYGMFDIGRSMLGIDNDRGNLRPDEFWALNSINFELKEGEALGIIGQNGSGKTTLLRLINGIFPPDKGRITVRGRMGALLAVGAGFHPHMTGRENIFLNGTILGMTKEEIKREYDSIVDFADISEFLDAPVATYSSGMTIRLGFSIAVHSNPEILLADEVLAVGDLQFALKCYRKVTEYRQNGGALLLVSHGMQLVRNTCNKALWIDRGAIKEQGNAQSICDSYENYMMKKDALNTKEGGNRLSYDSLTQLTKVEFFNELGQSCSNFKVGEPFKVRIHFNCKRNVDHPLFSFGILSPENIILVCNYSQYDGLVIPSISGIFHVDFHIEKLLIKPGNYSCTITFAERELSKVLVWHERSYSFTIESSGTISDGFFSPTAKWEINQN